jgi:hypothetical protein
VRVESHDYKIQLLFIKLSELLILTVLTVSDLYAQNFLRSLKNEEKRYLLCATFQ